MRNLRKDFTVTDNGKRRTIEVVLRAKRAGDGGGASNRVAAERILKSREADFLTPGDGNPD